MRLRPSRGALFCEQFADALYIYLYQHNPAFRIEKVQ